MSRLIDKLNQIAEAAPKSIGFTAAQPAPKKPKLLLIASVAQVNSTERLADYAAGADAVLIARFSSGARSLQSIDRSLSGIPWGLRLGNIDRKNLKPIAEAGCDFVVFSTDTTLDMPEDEKIGKILQLETSLSEGLLRTINKLPVDAVLVSDVKGAEHLTWHHLMLFQRYADLVTKPLLVSAPSNVSAGELQLIWETGVDSVVVEVGIGQPMGKLKELRQAIEKSDFPARVQKKTAVLLPRVGGETGPTAEVEEEEDEEEE